jgi:hypothetical protein
MVRSCAEVTEFANNPCILLLEGTPSGRRDSRVFLEVGRPTKTPLNDVDSERGEDYRKRTMLLSTHRVESQERKIN